MPLFQLIKATGETKKALKEIKKSWDGQYFQVREENRIEVLDDEGAFTRWCIQPKADDSVLDLEIIHSHNRAVLSALRERGFSIPQSSFLEGNQPASNKKEQI